MSADGDGDFPPSAEPPSRDNASPDATYGATPASGRLEPDEEQITRYFSVLFPHADPGTYVHLKTLRDDGDGPWMPNIWPAVAINGSLEPVIDGASLLAFKAAGAHQKVVFAAPVATFKGPKGSREADVANGLTLSVDLDANPIVSLRILEAVLGPPTLIVKTGGKCADPETGEVLPKLHLHWRLSKPTRTPAEHARLREARALAKALVASDGSAVPLSHPLRCAGSWHRKAEPVLASIDDNGYRPDAEIDLSDALDRLRAAGAKAPSDFTPSPPRSPLPPPGDAEFEARIDTVIADLAPVIKSRIEAPPAPDLDRSEEVWSLVNSLHTNGLNRNEIIGILRRYPDGPALSKYGDRLEVEIDRILEKLQLPQAQRTETTADCPVWDAGENRGRPPPRGWLLANTLCRRCLSVLVASGGKGKTALRLLQLLSLAVGRSLTGQRVFHRARVLYVSLEDDRDELDRRLLAAMRHHDISREDLQGFFYIANPIGMKLTEGRDKPGPLERWLRATIKTYKIDIVCIDPLVKAHGLDENDNVGIDYVVTLLTRIAHDYDGAIDVLHHEGKANSGEPGDANRGRGATAIKDAARLCSTLTSMSEKERNQFGVSAEESRHLIRLDSGKVNILPPATDTSWFRLVGVSLDNGTSDYPNGDNVQTVEVWTPPNMWSDLTDDKSNAILDDIVRGLDDGSRYSSSPQAKKRAVWLVVQRHMPDYFEAKAKELIKTWEKNGLLKMEPYVDPNRREKQSGLVVDGKKRPGKFSPDALLDQEI